MKFEKIILFWNTHDLWIIQGLIGSILLLVIYLAIRIFFGKDTESHSSAKTSENSSQITADIEKTLQKILENQAAHSTSVPVTSGAASESVVAATPTASGADPAELNQLRTEVQAREEKIKKLEQQLAAAPAAGAGNSAELEKKIKDLESRLSEYEIISEDIADLSMLKEENAKLQQEITQLKAGGAPSASAASAPAVAPAPAVEAPIVANPPPAMAAAAEAASAQLVEEMAQQAPVPPATPPPVADVAPQASSQEIPLAVKGPDIDAVVAAAGSEESSPDAIDDDIMKEFMAAVQEQKATPKPAVDTELIGQFEQFVKKNE